MSHHYKSQCSQVYNYHRLLSWNKERGLHMDIYKAGSASSRKNFVKIATIGFFSPQVPTCCSCHIMGYAYLYPPLKKEAFSTKNKFKGEPIKSDDFFHAGDDDDFDDGFHEYISDDSGGGGGGDGFVGGFVPSASFPPIPNSLAGGFPKVSQVQADFTFCSLNEVRTSMYYYGIPVVCCMCFSCSEK